MNPDTGLSRRPLSRRLPLAIVGAGAVLALASSSSSSAAAPSADSSSAQSTAAEPTTDASGAPSSSKAPSASVNPQYAAFCASYKTFFESANKTDTSPQTLAAQLGPLAEQAPPELKADLTNAKTSLEGVSALYASGGAAAAGQKLAADPNYGKSVQAIVTWAEQNCGIVASSQANAPAPSAS